MLGGVTGLGLAALYLVLGVPGNELTQLLAYSLVLVGFPVVFALSRVLTWLGVQDGLSEYVGLVLLVLPLNGALGALVLASS